MVISTILFKSHLDKWMKLEEELQTWGWEGESCENDEAGCRNVVHANEIQPTGGWMCWK